MIVCFFTPAPPPPHTTTRAEGLGPKETYTVKASYASTPRFRPQGRRDTRYEKSELCDWRVRVVCVYMRAYACAMKSSLVNL